MRLVIFCASARASVLLAAPPAARRGGAPQAGTGAAPTHAGVVAAQTPCDLRVYVLDPDPQGVNVRSGPGKQFDVVARLPHDESSLLVHVSGATGQWVRISEAERMESGEGVFKGAGWVYAPGLGTQTRDYGGLDPAAPRVRIYRAASKSSAVVLRLPNETEVALTGCKGGWARIRHKRVEGWLAPDAQCPNTLTTCA
jgi:SH3-like domain-containing protein